MTAFQYLRCLGLAAGLMVVGCSDDVATEPNTLGSCTGAACAGSSAGGSSSSSSAGATTGGATAGGAPSGGTNGAAGNTSSGGSAGVTSGGASSTGGGAGGVTSNAACPGADASEFSLVSGWLHNTSAQGALPNYAYEYIGDNFPDGAAFDELACSIAMTCLEFAPMESGWLRKCEALLASAIVAESSYNPDSVVMDGYSTRNVDGTTANDPTVGLLQIRFSSTVHDYNYYGDLSKMEAIGCSWPSELANHADEAKWWATSGGTTYLSFMQEVPCNIGLAAWYYFYNATGNGGAEAVWIHDYCAGNGVAGNMVVGLLSHLMGGNFQRPADANNAYPWGIECCAGGSPNDTPCTGCTGRFAALLGIGTSASRPSPDPFQEVLLPEPDKYCK